MLSCPGCSAVRTSAFTRVFDALSGALLIRAQERESARGWVPVLRSSVPDDASHRRDHAASRPGHETAPYRRSANRLQLAWEIGPQPQMNRRTDD